MKKPATSFPAYDPKCPIGFKLMMIPMIQLGTCRKRNNSIIVTKKTKRVFKTY